MAVDVSEQLAKDTAFPNGTPENAISSVVSRRSMTMANSEQTPLPTARPMDDVPPDGGYGWICVICVLFINAHTWGVNTTYGVFLNYYLSSGYFPNTSNLTYAFVGGLSFSQALLIAPVATWIINRFGTKACLHIGIFFETLSLIGVSFSRREYQLILSQGFCFGLGMGFLFVGSVGIIPQWFSRRRSLANSVATAGSGMGGLIYSLAAQRIIDTLGLPWAYRVIGISSCVVNLIASNVIRDRNKAVGSRTVGFDWRLFKRPEFLLFEGWGFFSLLGYIVILFSLPSDGTSLGLSAKQGSILGALVSLGQMVGRPLLGLASDRWGRLNCATFFTFLCGIFCFVFWIPARGMGLMSFFALIGGPVGGTLWVVIAPVAAEIVGLQDLPVALSVTWLVLTPPSTVSEAIALQLRKPSGADNVYINAQIFTGMMYIGATVCLWLVRAWKVRQMEAKEREFTNPITEKHSRGDDTKLSTPPIALSGWTLKDLMRDLFVIKHV